MITNVMLSYLIISGAVATIAVTVKSLEWLNKMLT